MFLLSLTVQGTLRALQFQWHQRGFSRSLSCNYVQALSHVSKWRGKQATTVGKLLVELWKNEEASMGVSRNKTGAITGIHMRNDWEYKVWLDTCTKKQDV